MCVSHGFELGSYFQLISICTIILSWNGGDPLNSQEAIPNDVVMVISFYLS
jgi:hypothetical protein